MRKTMVEERVHRKSSESSKIKSYLSKHNCELFLHAPLFLKISKDIYKP